MARWLVGGVVVAAMKSVDVVSATVVASTVTGAAEPDVVEDKAIVALVGSARWGDDEPQPATKPRTSTQTASRMPAMVTGGHLARPPPAA